MIQHPLDNRRWGALLPLPDRPLNRRPNGVPQPCPRAAARGGCPYCDAMKSQEFDPSRPHEYVEVPGVGVGAFYIEAS